MTDSWKDEHEKDLQQHDLEELDSLVESLWLLKTRYGIIAPYTSITHPDAG